MMELRSIELELPEAARAVQFLVKPWGALAAAGGHAVRGTSTRPYLIALREAEIAAVASVTFVTDPDRINEITARAATAHLSCCPVESDDPGGGAGILVTLPDGERFRFLSGCSGVAPQSSHDAPVRLTHVVLNARDAEANAQMTERIFGFTVSDRTAGMVFVRCNASHHSIAFARAGYTSLNHIAFEMADIDAVMRGIGRMRDAGFAPAWGPGRHGPGANIFAYFIAPFGAVIEFSTAVETVAEDYPTGEPSDWTWPAGRIDHWGLSNKQVARLQAAEGNFRFVFDGDRP